MGCFWYSVLEDGLRVVCSVLSTLAFAASFLPPAAELRVQLVAGGSRWQGILVTDKRSAIMDSLAPGAQATRSMQLSTARLASAVKISLGSVVPVVTTSIKPSKVWALPARRSWWGPRVRTSSN